MTELEILASLGMPSGVKFSTVPRFASIAQSPGPGSYPFKLKRIGQGGLGGTISRAARSISRPPSCESSGSKRAAIGPDTYDVKNSFVGTGPRCSMTPRRSPTPDLVPGPGCYESMTPLSERSFGANASQASFGSSPRFRADASTRRPKAQASDSQNCAIDAQNVGDSQETCLEGTSEFISTLSSLSFVGSVSGNAIIESASEAKSLRRFGDDLPSSGLCMLSKPSLNASLDSLRTQPMLDSPGSRPSTLGPGESSPNPPLAAACLEGAPRRNSISAQRQDTKQDTKLSKMSSRSATPGATTYELNKPLMGSGGPSCSMTPRRSPPQNAMPGPGLYDQGPSFGEDWRQVDRPQTYFGTSPRFRSYRRRTCSLASRSGTSLSASDGPGPGLYDANDRFLARGRPLNGRSALLLRRATSSDHVQRRTLSSSK